MSTIYMFDICQDDTTSRMLKIALTENFEKRSTYLTQHAPQGRMVYSATVPHASGKHALSWIHHRLKPYHISTNFFKTDVDLAKFTIMRTVNDLEIASVPDPADKIRYVTSMLCDDEMFLNSLNTREIGTQCD